MKMVSAAKLRRAQEAMEGARPYARALRRTLSSVARRTEPGLHPLLATRDQRHVDLLVLTSDRGLCGSFNANIIKAVERWRGEATAEPELTLLGRKVIDYYRRRPEVEVRDKIEGFSRDVKFTLAARLGRELEERYVAGATDGVYIAYNEFRSVVSQRVVVAPLLPLSEIEILREPGEAEAEEQQVEYLYEPEPRDLLAGLLTRFVAFEIYHAMLESVAAEHAARMSAMDSASRNAQEMIEKLTLQMNRIRQAAITTEIIEVVSGAEALS
jgi:F-type H+-transporting ATPase subunit gamma